ncbi:MAG TPA: GMC oxidoreductase, partial [Ramlibacter sp.]
MGDRVEDGVVDDLGRVWVQDVAAPEIPPEAIEPESDGTGNRLRPHRYRGLHVLDGSIVPTALGCNPLLTITALAERALAAIPKKKDSQSKLQPAHTPRHAAAAAPSLDLGIDATLNETLMAQDLQLHGRLAKALQREVTVARLEASFPTGDLPAMLTARRHALPVKATLWIDAQVSREQVEPVQYRATEGQLLLLPAHWASSGVWPFVSTMGQALAVLGSIGCLVAGLFVSLPLAVEGLVTTGVLSVVLPLPRAAITWWALRGRRDAKDSDQTRAGLQRINWGRKLIWSMLRQMVHASEKRVMRYRVSLDLHSAPQGVDAPKRLTLVAHKRVVYRATIAETLAWLWARVWRREARIRDTFWEQVMDAEVRLVATGLGPVGRTLARGRFSMGVESLAGMDLVGDKGLSGPIAL